MAIHIEIHIGANALRSRALLHGSRKSVRSLALRSTYNQKSRHPLQGFSVPNTHAGNVRYGVPLALVAVIGGLASYAVAGRHVDTPDFARLAAASSPAVQHAPAQRSAQTPLVSAPDQMMLSPEQLAAIAPAAGEEIAMRIAQVAQATEATQQVPQTPQIPGASQAQIPPQPIPQSLPESLDVRPLSMSDLGPYLETGAMPIPPRPETARESAARRVVSVQKVAAASSKESSLVAAKRAYEAEDYQAAEELYASIEEKHGRDIRAMAGLATSYQKTGRSQEAMALYEKILKKDPQNVNATINLLGLLKDTHPDEAYERLTDLWNVNTNNPGVAAQLALSSAKVGNPEKALRYMGVAAALDPQNANHTYNLAVLTDKQGQRAQAIAFYEKALEIDAIYAQGQSIPRDLVYDRLYFLRRL